MRSCADACVRRCVRVQMCAQMRACVEDGTHTFSMNCSTLVAVVAAASNSSLQAQSSFTDAAVIYPQIEPAVPYFLMSGSQEL